MPFHANKTWKYDQAAVETLTPGQMGVYGIYKQGEWIYVGSGDIRERLLSHLRGDNTADSCINGQRPTNWIADVTTDYRRRESELIVELNPHCNRKVG